MEILANNLGKRYNFNWIFRNIQLNIPSGTRMVVLGANGSGKSTLLQILAGSVLYSEGDIRWSDAGNTIDSDSIYHYVSIAAPYLELVEDFTLREHLAFHFALKPVVQNLNITELIKLSTLEKAADRPLRYYSSGMKQRAKLLMAVCSDTPLLFLDEPLSNLDEAGGVWYLNLIERFGAKRTIIVASNHQQREYEFCEQQYSLGSSL